MACIGEEAMANWEQGNIGFDESKYRVVREEDETTLDPHDYFVLKRGDILAVAALRSYVDNILTLLDLDTADYADLTPGERHHLVLLADHLRHISDTWEADTTKLPD